MTQPKLTAAEQQILRERAGRALDLEDQLNDIMTGYVFWKEHKTHGMELTTLDEMLIRWMEYPR